jgi:hypothetical protein
MENWVDMSSRLIQSFSQFNIYLIIYNVLHVFISFVYCVTSHLYTSVSCNFLAVYIDIRGGFRGGGGGAPGAPPKIGKNMIFWLKIVIFHTKYPKHFRASLRSAHFF